MVLEAQEDKNFFKYNGRPAVSTVGFLFKFTAMRKYDFLGNVNKHIEQAQEKEKKEKIGLIINSLQRPFTEVLQAVCEKQKQDVEELYKSLGWKI